MFHQIRIGLYEVPQQVNVNGQPAKISAEFDVYAFIRPGGIDDMGCKVQPKAVYCLDVNGRGELWAWTDWFAFCTKVNALAGDALLDPLCDPLLAEGLLVIPQWGCPNCGQRLMDELDIVDDDEGQIRCLSCGHEYKLDI
jgi:hypothetical protein